MANYLQTLLNPVSTGPDSPYGVKSSREYAAELLKGSQAPVAHWAQGLGNITKALMGGYTEYKAGEQEKEGQQRSMQALLAALGLNTNPTQEATTPTAQPQPPLTQPASPQFAPPPNMNPMFADTPIMSVSDAPAATPQQANMPRGMRNNNPGNIIDGPFAKNLPGYAGTDGKFARFASLDDGNAAIDRLLKSYSQRGFNTPNSIVNRWAPPSDNNPTQAYANNVAKALGVDVNAPLDMNNPQTLSTLRSAITRQENGPVASLPQSQPVSAAPASAGVVPSSPAATPPINRQALAAIMMDPWASDATKAAVMQQLMPKSPLIVKEGDTVLNPVNMQPLYKNEKNENKWERVGTDPYGNPLYGWVAPNAKRVEATTVPSPQVQTGPQAQQQTATPNPNPQTNEITDPNNPNYPHIRPAPQGANTKDWYEAETKRVAAVRNSRPQQIQNAEIVTQDISRALNLIEKNPSKTTGTFAQILSGVGGSDAKNVASLLATIKTNAGFDKLQAMRNASPTGGALGSVSNQENEMLANAIGSLEQSQSADQLKYNLRRVSNIYNNIIHGAGNGPQRFELVDPNAPKTQAVKVNSVQEAMKLPKGTRFIDPNGIERVVP